MGRGGIHFSHSSLFLILPLSTACTARCLPATNAIRLPSACSCGIWPFRREAAVCGGGRATLYACFANGGVLSLRRATAQNSRTPPAGDALFTVPLAQATLRAWRAFRCCVGTYAILLSLRHKLATSCSYLSLRDGGAAVAEEDLIGSARNSRQGLLCPLPRLPATTRRRRRLRSSPLLRYANACCAFAGGTASGVQDLCGFLSVHLSLPATATWLRRRFRLGTYLVRTLACLASCNSTLYGRNARLLVRRWMTAPLTAEEHHLVGGFAHLCLCQAYRLPPGYAAANLPVFRRYSHLLLYGVATCGMGRNSCGLTVPAFKRAGYQMPRLLPVAFCLIAILTCILCAAAYCFERVALRTPKLNDAAKRSRQAAGA